MLSSALTFAQVDKIYKHNGEVVDGKVKKLKNILLFLNTMVKMLRILSLNMLLKK